MRAFLIVVTVLWALLHGYLARRLISPLSLRRGYRITLYLLAVSAFAIAPALFFTDDLLAEPYDMAYRWIGWTYVGAFTVLFAFIATRDLVLFSHDLALQVKKRRTGSAPEEETSIDRRRFLLKATNAGAVGATALLTGVGVHQARKLPELVEVEVPIRNLPKELDGYHIVQLSDVHVGVTIDKDFILPIVEMVTSLNPDLVALTGDLVDGSVDKLRADISPLGYLRAKDGLFCVTGNHEYYSGAEEWCTHFRELGLSVLINEHALIRRGDARLLVAGVTDYREGKRVQGHASDPAAALRNAPEHDVRILLAHQPRSARDAQKHGFALQLSGHTHGGQYFPWNLFVGLVERPTGLTKLGDNMWLYVSRGTCYWGPPVRTGVPAELTSLRLVRA